MPRYRVKIERTKTETATVDIWADNEEDAVNALQSAEAPAVLKAYGAAEWELDDENFDVVEEPEEVFDLLAAVREAIENASENTPGYMDSDDDALASDMSAYHNEICEWVLADGYSEDPDRMRELKAAIALVRQERGEEEKK